MLAVTLPLIVTYIPRLIILSAHSFSKEISDPLFPFFLIDYFPHNFMTREMDQNPPIYSRMLT